MNADNANLAVGSGTSGATGPARGGSGPGGGGRNVWPWVNWALALAMVPAAAIVMLFALGAVMSTDGCADRNCPHGGIDFGVAFYGAPAVAVVVIVISLFTAKRRGGIAVPLFGWALLIADVLLMVASVSG